MRRLLAYSRTPGFALGDPSVLFCLLPQSFASCYIPPLIPDSSSLPAGQGTWGHLVTGTFSLLLLGAVTACRCRETKARGMLSARLGATFLPWWLNCLPVLWPFQLCSLMIWGPLSKRQRKWSGPLCQKGGSTKKPCTSKTKQTSKIWSAQSCATYWYEA